LIVVVPILYGYAHQLLCRFIALCRELYSSNFIVHNLMTHIIPYAEQCGYTLTTAVISANFCLWITALVRPKLN
jgi:hypothetical protein